MALKYILALALAVISMKNVGGTAVGHCIQCPAKNPENEAVGRKCEREFGVDLAMDKSEKCEDSACYIKVIGDKVERGCLKDLKKEGKRYDTCNPMELYLDKDSTEPMYCECNQRKHCNDMNNWAPGAGKEMRNGRVVETKGSSSLLKSSISAPITIVVLLSSFLLL